jgi:hypothetical protein
VPGFVAVAPAALLVDAAAQGVHARIEVRANPHPEHPCVIADVDDRRQLVRGSVAGPRELAQPKQLLHAEQEAGSAHATDQNRDSHDEKVLLSSATLTDIRPSGRCGSTRPIV